MTINRYPPAWQSDLHDTLSRLQAGFPEAYLYALIEGVHNEDCYPFAKRSRLPHYALYAGTPSADEETLCISPLLLAYRAEEQATWDRLLAKTSGRPALSIIVTQEPLAALVRRLTPWCMVDAAGYPLALAFADTRILPELFDTLTPAQREQLCGPMVHWQYVTRDAQWRNLPVPVSATELADVVALDDKQCAHLTNAAEADHVLYQLRTADAGRVDCHSPARAHALVRFWLACADHAQLAAAPDRRSLCEWGFVQPGIEQHPQIAAWLESPSAPVPLANLLQQWQAAFSESPSSTSTANP